MLSPSENSGICSSKIKLPPFILRFYLITVEITQFNRGRKSAFVPSPPEIIET